MPQVAYPPFPVFFDTDGSPLSGGYIYVGTANLNPETSPIQAYWDAALTQPAAVPLRTLNGYISRSGTVTNAYVSPANYSITVRNSAGVLVYSSLSEQLVSGGGTASQYVAGDGSLIDFGTSVRGSVLTGLSLASSADITAADTVLSAFGKLQAQLDLTQLLITAGTTAQYYRGDKTFQDLFTQVRAAVLTGIATTKAVTAVVAADTVLQGLGKLQAQTPYAMGRVASAGGLSNAGSNIASAAHTSTGVYTLTFTTPLFSVNTPIVLVTVNDNATVDDYGFSTSYEVVSTTSIKIRTRKNNSTAALTDTNFSVLIFDVGA